MLRASCKNANRPHNLGAIGNPTVDSLLQGGAELLASVDAAVLRDDHEIEEARAALVERLGEAKAVRVFAVAGNFEMMNRLVDGLGVQPTKASQSIAGDVGVPYNH
ncbi:MAG: hypothetical protein ACKVHU_12540 [Acidimicrobiales bacterium]|jgi:hypothetical protein